VAEDHGTPGAEVVDIAIAVRVDDPSAMGPLDKRRRAADCTKSSHRRVDAARKKSLGSLLQGLGSGADAGWELGTHGGFSIEGDATMGFS